MKKRQLHKIEHYEKGIPTKKWSDLIHKRQEFLLIKRDEKLNIGDKVSVSDESGFWFVKKIKTIQKTFLNYWLVSFSD